MIRFLLGVALMALCLPLHAFGQGTDFEESTRPRRPMHSDRQNEADETVIPAISYSLKNCAAGEERRATYRSHETCIFRQSHCDQFAINKPTEVTKVVTSLYCLAKDDNKCPDQTECAVDPLFTKADADNIDRVVRALRADLSCADGSKPVAGRAPGNASGDGVPSSKSQSGNANAERARK